MLQSPLWFTNANHSISPDIETRLRSPRKSSHAAGSPKRRTFPEDLCRFYIRNAKWVFLTLLASIFMIHWRISLEDATTQPPHMLVPDAPKLSKTERKHRKNRQHGATRDNSTNILYDYSAALHPVIPRTLFRPKTTRPLRVVLVGRKEGPLSAPAESSQLYFPANLLLDGLDRSEYIKVIQWIEYNPHDRTHYTHNYHTNPINEPLAVIVDWAALSRDCHVLKRLWKDASLEEATANRNNVYLLYMDLSASSRTVVCPEMEKWVAKDRIRVARRGIVQGRHWKQTKGWVEVGRVQNNQGSIVSGGLMLHMPYFLRESFVDQLERVAESLGVETKNLVRSAPRKVDVAHFWRKGDYSHYSFLRRLVSSLVVAYDESASQRVRSVVRALGDGDALEVHHVEREYVDGLVTSKIVVIAQKDEWEDHYRLMESLASGALVLSDSMLAPPNGLKNRTNIVFYDGPNSLRWLLEYYLDPHNEEKRLSIAQKGFEYAMGQQRAWHGMESILFGTPLTQVGKPLNSAPPRKHPPKTSPGHGALMVATA